MRVFILLPLIIMVAGCVTYRDKVAVVRGAKYAAEQGTETGDAVSGELSEVAIDIGADKAVDPATVEVTAEAARTNAAGIRAERQSRAAILGLLKAAGAKLVGAVPWLRPILEGAIGIFALNEWRKKLKAVASSKRAGEIVGVLGRGAEKLSAGVSLKDVLREEAKGLVHVNTKDIEQALEDAKSGEI